MSRLVVAGPSQLVTKAARIVGERGGSVVDVAVAAALTATCVEPGVAGPAAGGFYTVRVPGADPVVVDGYMAVPGKGFEGERLTRVVEMTYGGGTTTIVGPGSIAVPGIFAASHALIERFGAVPWAQILDDVAGIVDAGFPMTQAAYDYMVEGGDEIYDQDPETSRAMFRNGEVAPVGETLYFDDLGETLRWIGEEGADAFHKGELGSKIVDDLEGRGSALTRRDLEEYEVAFRRPLDVGLDGWRLLTNPAPAVGGAALALALGSIVRSETPLGPDTWLDSLRHAFEVRVGDLEMAPDRDSEIARVLIASGLRSPSTISVAAMDSEGGAVAATFSAGYGSGVIPKGTGLLMNNGMGEVELNPGGPDIQKPGERLMSNMAPTIASHDGRSVAVASPGADRITTALTITLTRMIVAGDDIREAIEHPRLHPRPSGAAVEPGIEIELEGDALRRYPQLNMYFGGVVGTDWTGEELNAHSDSRRGGSVAFID